MLAYLARYWWLLAVRGAAGVLCGLLALLWPGVTLAALVVLFGAYALVDGVLEPTLAFRRGSPCRRRPRVAGPARRARYLGRDSRPHLARVHCRRTAACRGGPVARDRGLPDRRRHPAPPRDRQRMVPRLGRSNLGAVRQLRVRQPGPRSLALVWLIGLYALVFGVTLIAGGFRLRGHRVERPEAQRA